MQLDQLKVDVELRILTWLTIKLIWLVISVLNAIEKMMLNRTVQISMQWMEFVSINNMDHLQHMVKMDNTSFGIRIQRVD
jgi:hypothetical protein